MIDPQTSTLERSPTQTLKTSIYNWVRSSVELFRQIVEFGHQTCYKDPSCI